MVIVRDVCLAIIKDPISSIKGLGVIKCRVATVIECLEQFSGVKFVYDFEWCTKLGLLILYAMYEHCVFKETR